MSDKNKNIIQGAIPIVVLVFIGIVVGKAINKAI